MTQADRLISNQRCRELILNCFEYSDGIKGEYWNDVAQMARDLIRCKKQLAETMRENERLLNAFKYGHACLINVGYPNLAELMAMTAGRHKSSNVSE